jgi:hypothetical protein
LLTAPSPNTTLPSSSSRFGETSSVPGTAVAVGVAVGVEVAVSVAV